MIVAYVFASNINSHQNDRLFKNTEFHKHLYHKNSASKSAASSAPMCYNAICKYTSTSS